MPRPSASADPFRAIADPTRRDILDLLRAGPRAVNELAVDFAQSRPAISKHLRILRESRMVREERQGRTRVYRLEPRPLREVDAWLNQYREFWVKSLNRLKQHLEQEP